MSTHRSTLARALSQRTGTSYQQCLELVRRASQAGLLSPVLDEAGMALSLEQLMTWELRDPKRLPTQFVIGTRADGEEAVVRRQDLAYHVGLFGAESAEMSGALETLVAGMAGLGWSGLVIDAGSEGGRGGLCDLLRTTSFLRATPFVDFGVGKKQWNPLESLSHDEAVDLVTSFLPFDDSYWESVVRRLVDCGLAVLEPLGLVSLSNLADLLGRDNVLAILAAGIDKHDERQVWLNGSGKDSFRMSELLYERLVEVIETAPVLGGGVGSNGLFKEGLTYLPLPSSDGSSRYGLNAALRAAHHFVATRVGEAGRKDRRFVVVTRAAKADQELLRAVVEKARAASVTVVVQEQGADEFFDQSAAGGRDDFAHICQNLGVLVLGSQRSQSSAEAALRVLESRGGSALDDPRQYAAGQAAVVLPGTAPEMVRLSLGEHSESGVGSPSSDEAQSPRIADPEAGGPVYLSTSGSYEIEGVEWTVGLFEQ